MLNLTPSPEWGEEGKDWMSKGQKGRLTLICSHCGCSFERWPSQVKEGRDVFCSRPCLSKSQERRVELTCEQCGHQFQRSVSSACRVRNHFCSLSCQSESLRKPAETACHYCGGAFHRCFSRASRNKKQFCSPSCAHQSRRVWVDVTCGECECVISRIAYRVRGNRHFCSVDCRNLFNARDPSTLNNLYRGGLKAATKCRVYTPEMVLRFYAWTGETCAFPLCNAPQSNRNSSKHWHLCRLHAKRYDAFRRSAIKRYARRINELN